MPDPARRHLALAAITAALAVVSGCQREPPAEPVPAASPQPAPAHAPGPPGAQPPRETPATLDLGSPILAMTPSDTKLLVATTAGSLLVTRGKEGLAIERRWKHPTARAAAGAGHLLTAAPSGKLTVWDATGSIAEPGVSNAGPLAIAGGPTVAWRGGEKLDRITVWRRDQVQRRLRPRGLLGDIGLLSLSPDGNHLLIAGTGTLSLWLRPSFGDGETLLDGHLDAPTEVSWSPDGDRFASRDLSPMVLVWARPTPTAAPEPTTTVTPDSAPKLPRPYGPIALAPNHLAIATPKTLALLPPSKTAPTSLASTPSTAPAAMSWWNKKLASAHGDFLLLHTAP